MECSEKVWNMLSVPHCMPLAFSPSPSILEAKIEDRVYNVVAFCAGTRLDRGAEERTYGTLGHGVCNRGKKGHSEWSDQRTLL